MRRIKKDMREEVTILNGRLQYLNDLRVSAGRFYVLVAGAVLALSTMGESHSWIEVVRYAGLPIAVAGFCVLGFDINMRMRSKGVAKGIRDRTELDPDCESVNQGEQVHIRYPEDFFFALIIATMNASVVTAFLGSLVYWPLLRLCSSTAASAPPTSQASSASIPAGHAIFLGLVGIGVFVGLILAQAWFWKKRTGGWTDQDLEVSEWPI